MAEFNYPPVHPDKAVVDVFHGIPVTDPYRCLEDTGSAATKSWVEAQNALTRSVLDTVPGRDKIADRITAISQYERVAQPFRIGKQWFSLCNNSRHFYVSNKPVAKNARLFLDLDQFPDKDTVSLAQWSFSWNGKLLAYGISRSGSTLTEWHVRDIESGQDLPDIIHGISSRETVDWTPYTDGFYYVRDKGTGREGESDQTSSPGIYFHKLGEKQDTDELIYNRPAHPDWQFKILGWRRHRLYIYIFTDTSGKSNRLIYKDLQKPEAPVVELFAEDDALYYAVSSYEANKLWLYTTKDAPLGRLVSFDLRFHRGGTPKLKEIIPQSDMPLHWVARIKNRLVAIYKQGSLTEYHLFSKNGKSYGKIDLPGLGKASGFGSISAHSRNALYTFESYTQPPAIYEYDLRTGKSKLFWCPKTSFNPDEYVAEQVFYQSKDGTRIPMFISYKKGLQKNGTNPTLLNGYGGFNRSQEPGFSAHRMAWMEMGGIYAIANLRGGGEYGKDWHQAGTKLQKQNVFDDFIAGAEWLINTGYTSKEKLAINGGSNGGLLVGTCLTQRPDLFAAAITWNGVFDMLRFSKFTCGHSWIDDYGNVDNEEEFQALFAYSPVHNVHSEVNYPATLIMVGDKDDRVVPSHSYKFGAALQAAQKGDNPILLRVEAGGTHNTPTWEQYLNEAVDTYAFLTRYLNLTDLSAESKSGSRFLPASFT